jgi:hypothetical protein
MQNTRFEKMGNLIQGAFLCRKNTLSTAQDEEAQGLLSLKAPPQIPAGSWAVPS